MGIVSLFLLLSLAHAEPARGGMLAVGRVGEWVRSVGAEGRSPAAAESGTLGSAPAETPLPGLAAPRVGIAWPLAAGQDQAAAVLVELIAGPAGALERHLVYTQELAVRVEGGSVLLDDGGGALVVLVQLRPGVHPGVAQAAVESTVDLLLGLDDARLQVEIDRAAAALARDRRLAGALPAEPPPPVQVAELRSFAATLGMPSAWRVAVFRPQDPQ